MRVLDKLPGASREPILDVDAVRRDFPALWNKARGRQLVYLDNAATTHKPWQVINRVRVFDAEEYATVRRGVYQMSERATEEYENARSEVANFIGAGSPNEIVFTSGATMSINLVAGSYGRAFINSGDEIIISTIEHHANIVPWQRLCEEKGATLKVIPVSDTGELLLDEYERLLSDKTRIVAVTQLANSIGAVVPVRRIVRMAKRAGAVTLIDGAQATPHMNVNVRETGCDFYVFSGHKIYGPSGVGVLYGRKEILDKMPPFITGGDMITRVSFDGTIFQDPPHRFEAGTPPISQVVGLSAALRYVKGIGMNRIRRYEAGLYRHGRELLDNIPGLRIIGGGGDVAGIISFTLDDAHPHDVATFLDMEGIAVRAGHHCAQPAMDRFGVEATTRISLSFYNTIEELNRMADVVSKITDMFGR